MTTTTMQNFALTWTTPDGVHRASAVAYDEPTAQELMASLESGECISVEIVVVKPGELPSARS
ncbi:hypothetical protein ACFV4T_04405 [Streptomyces sp. NPDC059755]|uniref:hypothetical protein n=1 Tax=Streptomyces sp. NPDC059755 TaxID=3346934 RepID=UPI0036587E89